MEGIISLQNALFFGAIFPVRFMDFLQAMVLRLRDKTTWSLPSCEVKCVVGLGRLSKIEAWQYQIYSLKILKSKLIISYQKCSLTHNYNT